MSTRDRAKSLRANMTEAERLLWFHLRGHRFGGCKFRRQQPLGRYIVDFVTFAHRLIIEVDGSQHLESTTDAERDRWITNQGFRIQRFWNHEVLQETEAVLTRILQLISAQAALAQSSDASACTGDSSHIHPASPP